jgi:hypothetical protein
MPRITPGLSKKLRRTASLSLGDEDPVFIGEPDLKTWNDDCKV